MPRWFLPIFFLLFCTSIKAQIKSKKKSSVSLPGVVPLKGEYLFIDEVEVSNLAYLEFLAWLRQTKDSCYSEMIPDSNVWRSAFCFSEIHARYYLWSPEYVNYPVVGITHEQAVAYCNWREERIMQYLRIIDSNIDSIEIRLPSEREWKMAAKGTLPDGTVFPWEEKGIRHTSKEKYRGYILANFKRSSQLTRPDYYDIHKYEWDQITTEVVSYWPNTLGLYNMAGNVSEWVEEHKAMGSNWNSYPYQARLDYSPPVLPDSFRSSTIGFRCVIEIISFKKDIQSEPLKLKVKNIEKEMRYLPYDSIYNPCAKDQWLFASESEVTNRMFNTFLAETKQYAHRSKPELWYEYTRYHHMKMYAWHPYYDDFPVVNVSYESAQAYCEWLTDKYNSLKKRKYKKVEFRLPTKLEWEYAAAGGRTRGDYPWGGDFLRNMKGCFLANYCPLEEQYISGIHESDSGTRELIYTCPNDEYAISRTADGVEFLCKADSYFPNDWGLYQMSGNAAEMVAEKGITKGGHWNANQQALKITQDGQYDGPDATVGFRVFMKVLEQW
jgi:formylglycine-generating enzyme required for sulfatase activity